MKIWVVVGVSELWDDEDVNYAACATEELAKRELDEARKEDSNLLWRIEEWEVIDK